MAGLVGGVAVASVAAFAATGNVVFGFAPVLVAVVLYAFWVLPLWYSAITFSFVTLVLSNRPVPLPGDGKGQWAPPLYSVFSLLVDNLNTATGIDALRFSGAEVVYVAMVLLVTARVVRGIRIDAAGRLPGANVLYAALAVSFAGVLLLEVEGLARGGDFRQSLWQLRQLLWLPVLTGLFSYCLRDLRDLRTIAGLATLAACVKVALGLFFMVTVAWPSGYAPDVMTGHDDSVLYGSVVACCCAVWVHHPTRRWFVRMLVPCAWVVVGIAVNNRRLAFVSLFASLFVLYVMLQGRMRRQINRGVLLMLPVFALYLLAGRNRRSGIFKPAALVMSVGAQKDASSKTRDIENYNLTQTLKPNKILGTGWGHEYNEVVQAYDISKAFSQYRYIAHNSVLWLLSIGGIVGFTMLWMPVPVGVYLAARSYRFARAPAERVAAATALGVLVCYVLQAWGDMGTQSVGISLLVAWTLAGIGKLARATGAWPGGVQVVNG